MPGAFKPCVDPEHASASKALTPFLTGLSYRVFTDFALFFDSRTQQAFSSLTILKKEHTGLKDSVCSFLFTELEKGVLPDTKAPERGNEAYLIQKHFLKTNSCGNGTTDSYTFVICCSFLCHLWKSGISNALPPFMAESSESNATAVHSQAL